MNIHKAKLKFGDRVTIADGSYALEIGCRKYDDMIVADVEPGYIGLSKQEFIVMRVIPPTYVPEIQLSPSNHDNKPIPIYDIVIEDTENGKRYLHSSAFVELTQPKKTVKDLRELVNTLIDEGYVPDSDGDWILLDCGDDDTCFCVEMFGYCGKEPDDEFYWKESWLTPTKLTPYTIEYPIYMGV